MMEFILLALVLLVTVLWMITITLFTKKTNIPADNNDSVNIKIAKERIADVDLQLKNNEITQAQYKQFRNEIESSLLDDVRHQDETEDSNLTSTLPVNYNRSIIIFLALIPLAAFGLYQLWGTPDALQQSSDIHSSQFYYNDEQLEKHTEGLANVITKLEVKLAQQPNNSDGWQMLARSYSAQKQFKKSVAAYRRLYALEGEQPSILLALAETLAQSRNGDTRGEPFKLAKRALTLEPDNPTALWLSAQGYQENGDLTTAIKLWQKLLPSLTEEPRAVNKVVNLIRNTQQQLKTTTHNAPVTTIASPGRNLDKVITTPARLQVRVQLAPDLLANVSDDDFLLIYAQRITGTQMPVAIIKTRVKHLPITVILDDSKSASQVNKLSDAKQVNIIARISKSGQAGKRVDDIETKTGPYPVRGSKLITIILERSGTGS